MFVTLSVMALCIVHTMLLQRILACTCQSQALLSRLFAINQQGDGNLAHGWRARNASIIHLELLRRQRQCHRGCLHHGEQFQVSSNAYVGTWMLRVDTICGRIQLSTIVVHGDPIRFCVFVCYQSALYQSFFNERLSFLSFPLLL